MANYARISERMKEIIESGIPKIVIFSRNPKIGPILELSSKSVETSFSSQFSRSTYLISLFGVLLCPIRSKEWLYTLLTNIMVSTMAIM